MVDKAALRETIQSEPDSRGFTGDQVDQVTQELNVLARILIDAVGKGGRHDRTN